MPNLVLASSSRWRKQLLEQAGFKVQAIDPAINERLSGPDKPPQIAVNNAVAKVAAVAQMCPNAWILGADQVIAHKGQVRGKPNDASDQLDTLRELRGCSHWLHTGFCVVSPSGERRTGVEHAQVQLRGDLTDAELRAYVDTGEGLYCAGGYAIEQQGIWLMERVEGDWLTIVGLPVIAVISVLRELGWRYGQP